MQGGHLGIQPVGEVAEPVKLTEIGRHIPAHVVHADVPGTHVIVGLASRRKPVEQAQRRVAHGNDAEAGLVLAACWTMLAG